MFNCLRIVSICVLFCVLFLLFDVCNIMIIDFSICRCMFCGNDCGKNIIFCVCLVNDNDMRFLLLSSVLLLVLFSLVSECSNVDLL